MKVQKRDQSIVEFNPTKITAAIFSAARAVGGSNYQLSVKLTDEVVRRIGNLYKDCVAVEEIQDIVEEVLVDGGHYKTAKAYILYRFKRNEVRDYKKLETSSGILTYLGKDDMRTKENANMGFSLQGLNVSIAEEASKKFWLDLYPEPIKNAYENGDFHIHDLGVLAPYCVGWDLKDLLLLGFKGVTGKIASSPPKHFRTALGQVVNFFYTLQGEAAGAQAFSNFDTLLAPFIRYDNLDYKQVKQALQEFAFNINVPTRVGFQTPFTNITMDLKVPEYMENEPVIIGGQYMESTYKDFQAEMDLLNQVFAEVMLEGDAEERVFTFPIPTYNITKDFDWSNPKYDGIWEMTAKYGIPYFANYINSDMNPEDARSMCCRLRIDNTEIRKRMGGLFAASPLTGSIGVVTINLARIGYLAKDKDEYFTRLGMLMDLARDSLEIKRKTIENWTEEGLYPYTKYYLRGVKQQSGSYWENHFSTIGIVGMHESCLNFLKEGLYTSFQFAGEVMDFMLTRCACYQEKTGHLYNLEATPAEGAATKLAIKDREKYPAIITSGTIETPYYTNSTQLPVGYTDDLFMALHHQESLQTRYTGGTVFHTFLGEKAPDKEAAKNLVKKICSQFKLPYITITPTFSICSDHGYINGEQYICPICGNKTEVFSRIVGYIRPVQQWNKGQRTQFQARATFDSALGRERVLELV
jgi:anaerobic ribonucleoside-triphosphate reductase